MENTHQAATPTLKILDGQKMDFNDIMSNFRATLNPTLEMFKKDPVNFALVYALPILLGGVLVQIVVPLLLAVPALLSLIGILGIAFAVLAVALSIVSYVALVKAAIEKAKGGKIDLMACYTLAAKNIINTIVLGVKSFLQIFKGIYPFFNAAFSLVYFIEGDAKDIEGSIKMSQDHLQGKTITMILNVVLIAIVTGVASAVFATVWTMVLGFVPYIGGLGSVVSNALFTSFVVLFQYVLKTQLEKMHGAPAHAAPAAHHNS